MKVDRFVQRWGGLLGVLAALAPLFAAPEPQAPQPVAGKITTLIPVGSVIRERKAQEAKNDMPVLWGDMIRTERGGRARVRLEDGSLLNVGSQASLVIHKHDPGTQQTELELIYGKVRANAAKIASPQGGFEVRTKVAVAGIVGTDEYLEATDTVTTVIALGGGQVTVSATDPRFPEKTVLDPGETVSLIAGRPPGPKRLATTEELLRAVQDTEADSVATLNPKQSLAGRSFEATISGKGLQNTKGLSFNQAGLTAQTRGNITATQIPVTITVGADVPAGTYTLTIDRPEGAARASLVVTTQAAIEGAQGAAASAMQPPASQSLTATRGAKIALDASGTRTPSGTQIVSYQWRVVNTPLAASDSSFNVNTSLLSPGNYTVQLTVVNDRGQVATQQYPLTVDAGVQPAEIVRNLASAYESLQPGEFLKNFDDQKFRNYSGFAAAIEDSFRNKLETVRVFQRPVNCAVVEEQDQGVCQADFELRFTLKVQPMELLDAQGNPIPPGVAPPPNATLGKRVLSGSERATIRFERGNAGWKVADYSAVVSCPSGVSTTGVNVGSCVLALGSATTPSFQIVNLQLFSADLPLGGSVSGSFAVSPIGGFTGSITFDGQGQINDQSIALQFTPNPSGPTATVNFTVFAPTTAPTGFNGATPFTLVITGQDSSGSVRASTNASLVLQPDFSLSVQPATTASAPAPVTHNSTLPLTVQIVSNAGFTGTVFIDFPNLPAGFTAKSGNLASGAPGSFPITVDATASPGPALITVRGTFGSGLVRTATVFVNVTSDFALSVTPVTTLANPAVIIPGGTLQISVQVVAISGFAGTVAIDFPSLPTGLTATGGNVAAGATGVFPLQNTLAAGPTVFPLTVRGRFGTAVQTVAFFVQVTVIPAPGKLPSSGSASLSLAQQPATSVSAPVLLSPDTSTKSFVNIEVAAGDGFAGRVRLILSNLPSGVDATLVPAEVDLSASPLQVVQLHFQIVSGTTAFRPTGIVVTAASDSLTAETTVFIAPQTGSPLPGPSVTAGTQAPRVLQVRDPGGTSGAYTPVTIFGESLGSITSVLSDSPQLSATLEPGGTNTQVQLSVFVRPGAAPGRHTLLLSGPRGTVPIAFTVKPAELEAEDDSHAIRAPAARPSAKSALLSREKLLERDEELPARTSRTAISGVFPANLKPGDVVEGKLFGTNLGNVTSVRTSGSGIRVEVLEARPSELRVRFTVDEEADSGSRLLTVKAGENKATTTVEVAAPRNRLAATPSGRVAETAGDSAQTVARPEASGRAATPRDTNVSLALPDLVVRAEDFTMTPVNPRPGDTVTFHIRVRNAGGRRVEDAPIEFSIVGTAVRQHEQITLEPGASQTFDFEWKAAGTGRLEPRVAIDPQNRIEQVTRANKIAALGPFELVSPAGSLGAVGAGGPPVHGAATRQREQLHLPLGACVGFRLASGTEQSCGGGADFEMRSGPEGNTLVIEADGVRNLGGVPLDQVTAASGEALAATETVVAGATYLIQTRRGVAALRVAQVRGLGAARSVPPATLRGPRLGGVEREPRAVEERSGVTVVLEWRVLPQ